MLYSAIRPALFALDPERAHAWTLRALQVAAVACSTASRAAPIELMGLHFANRVGLAAGFDKNALAVDGLSTLGFGFLEVGTVTPRPQPGRPRPRMFRFPDAEALLNRLGFPNEGAIAVADRLRRRRYRGIVGVNIGKNADTPLERAIDDYLTAFRAVRDVADYIAINVSSPNTASLRDLQTRERLLPLLAALQEERARTPPRGEGALPLLVKISPDLAPEELAAIAATVAELRIDGIIATNSTVSRALLTGSVRRQVESAGDGGISGRPLHALALKTVARLRELLGSSFPIIGVGGIDTPQAALAMRAAGADLVQLYTGLVYHGPSLAARCARALDAD
jgi:dihydroorotate dehydrogenase